MNENPKPILVGEPFIIYLQQQENHFKSTFLNGKYQQVYKTQRDIQTYRHTDIQTYRHKDIQTYRHGIMQSNLPNSLLSLFLTYGWLNQPKSQWRSSGAIYVNNIHSSGGRDYGREWGSKRSDKEIRGAIGAQRANCHIGRTYVQQLEQGFCTAICILLGNFDVLLGNFKFKTII